MCGGRAEFIGKKQTLFRQTNDGDGDVSRVRAVAIGQSQSVDGAVASRRTAANQLSRVGRSRHFDTATQLL